jgi:AcrR family transcriptional regulator
MIVPDEKEPKEVAFLGQGIYGTIVVKKAAGDTGGKRGRPRSFEKEAALERAMVLFWERGYEATSMDDLTAAMGISPSSLYATFGGKEQLYRAAIERYVAGPGGYIGRIFAEEPTAQGAVRRLLEAAAHELTRKDRPAGCMVSLAVTHCSPDAEPVQASLRELRHVSRGLLKTRIERSIEAGELGRDTDADALATFYVTVLQGMSVQARDGASPESLLAIGEAAMRAWPDARPRRTT